MGHILEYFANIESNACIFFWIEEPKCPEKLIKM